MAKEKKKSVKKLTPKQKKFCNEYLLDLNATQAAIRAGYSKKSAAIQGCENLTKPNIQNKIKENRERVQKNTDITPESVVRELAKIGFANIKGVFDDNNEIVDISKLPDDITAAIESIQSDIRHDSGDSDGYTEKVKVKFHSKLHALTDLGKHLGIFEKDNKQKQTNLADFLKAMVSE